MNIAGFGAFDYFGDGSFYLLDTPGVSKDIIWEKYEDLRLI